MTIANSHDCASIYFQVPFSLPSPSSLLKLPIHSLRKHLLSIESPYSKLGSTPIFLTHYCDLLLLYFLVRLRKSSILILILVRWIELTSTLKLSRDLNLVSILVGMFALAFGTPSDPTKLAIPNFPTASFLKGVLVR